MENKNKKKPKLSKEQVEKLKSDKMKKVDDKRIQTK